MTQGKSVSKRLIGSILESSIILSHVFPALCFVSVASLWSTDNYLIPFQKLQKYLISLEYFGSMVYPILSFSHFSHILRSTQRLVLEMVCSSLL